MAEENGHKPVFDFDDVSYGWSRDWMKAVSELGATTTLIDAPMAEGISDIDKHRVTLAKVEAVERLDSLISRRDQLVCDVLVDVPREWLVKGAPLEIDWRCADSLRYIKSRKINDLIVSMQEAQSAYAENSKN